MMHKPSIRGLVCAGLVALSACKESSGPGEVGPPAQIVVIAGAPQSARANTELTTPLQVSVRDADGQGVPDQTVTFTITAGGGSFPGPSSTATATTDGNGTATAPAWRLGKSAVPQTMRAQVAGITKDDISVNVQTAYNITIRFFGEPMTAQQQVLFTNAAARISGIITGDIIDADARGGTVDPAQCGVTGQPNLNEIIDDVLIYAAITSIDGQGKILAQAGPCLVRSTGTGPHTAVGVMQFDSADLASLTGGGSLQDVITHEMFHVVGVGTLWNDRSILTDTGTTNPRYTGTQGRQGCLDIGGSVACAANVPVEDQGGEGTRDAHWRESTFNTELMTGFLDASANPISALTVKSLLDLGFVVNTADTDTYAIFNNALRAGSLVASAPREEWENVSRPFGVLENRTIRPLRPR